MGLLQTLNLLLKGEEMKMEISLPDKLKSLETVNFITDKVEASFQRHKKVTETVKVRIRDENAQKGGIDKRCTILLISTHRKPLIVSSLGTSLESAFVQTLNRLNR